MIGRLREFGELRQRSVSMGYKRLSFGYKRIRGSYGVLVEECVLDVRADDRN